MQNILTVKKNHIVKDGGAIRKFEKDGILINKKAPLTEEMILANLDLYKKYCNFFTAYPDLFIDLLVPSDSSFQLFFYQRICKKVPHLSNKMLQRN